MNKELWIKVGIWNNSNFHRLFTSFSQLNVCNVKRFTSPRKLCTPSISLIPLTLWLKIEDCSRYSKYSLLLIIAFQTSYIAVVSRQLPPLVILTLRLVQQLAVPVNTFPVTSWLRPHIHVNHTVADWSGYQHRLGTSTLQINHFLSEVTK